MDWQWDGKEGEINWKQFQEIQSIMKHFHPRNQLMKFSSNLFGLYEHAFVSWLAQLGLGEKVRLLRWEARKFALYSQNLKHISNAGCSSGHIRIFLVQFVLVNILSNISKFFIQNSFTTKRKEYSMLREGNIQKVSQFLWQYLGTFLIHAHFHPAIHLWQSMLKLL